MKTILLFNFLLAGLFLLSCKKTTVESKNEYVSAEKTSTPAYTGTWILSEIITEGLGTNVTSEPDKIELLLNADSTYSFSKNDTLFSKGDYCIYAGKCVYSLTDTSLIQFTNYYNNYPLIVNVNSKADTMVITPQTVCAITRNVYIRQKH